MNNTELIAIFPTVVLIWVICKQVSILYSSEVNDVNRSTKLMFPIFNILIVTSTWCFLRGIPLVAVLMICCISSIAFWTYTRPN